jgi:hypothetical protein
MSSVINYITTGGLYVLFGVWSFFQVLEYKYYTRVEQYDTIVENMRICKQKYGELLLKMRQLEDHVDELEDILLEHNLEDLNANEIVVKEEETDLGGAERLEEEKLSLESESLKRAELNVNEIVVKEELNEVKEEELNAAIVKEALSLESEEELNAAKEEEEELNEAKEELNEVKEEDEMVDISEETYPIKNQAQNKKGWLKTILFL